MSDRSAGEVARRMFELLEARRWGDAKELLADDFIAEWPHSGERFRGRDNFIDVQINYPGHWKITVLRVVAAGTEAVTEVRVDHDTDGRFYATSFFDVEDGRVRRLREYWVTEQVGGAPEWRSRWAERIDPT